ncbi:MAG: CehA/McbA family metallohydrolase, partial [Myxococcales bacterium]|nr:CehA/McbA family metallohydrolase [Myxococcales bacterium]
GPDGPPVPARLTLFAGDEPVRWGVRDFLGGRRQANGYCWVAPGALATWDGLILPWGEATIPADAHCGADPWLVPGTYRVWAWRGLEYQPWEATVALGERRVELTIPLERAFDPGDAIAADLHVHAAASPDSTVPKLIRVLTMAASGIRVVALSDHNWNGDLDDEIALTGLAPWIASIASNELGSDWVHAGVYPVTIDRAAPRGGSPSEDDTRSWSAARVMAWGRGQPGRPIVQINHPRYRVNALFDVAGWDGVSWPPPFALDFDAVEVLAGTTVFNLPGDRRLDDGVRDFYTLIDHGVLVAGVGNSDTHHLDGIRDGLSRTYVFVDDPRTAPFDQDAFVDAVRARRAIATTGPWLDVEATGDGAGVAGPGQILHAPGGVVHLDVAVAQARFSRADRLRVLVGTGDGARIVHDVAVPPGDGWRGRLDVTLPRDGWIGVDVGGEEPLPWAMTGNLHSEEGRPGAVPFAIINPILVDADADGWWRLGLADVGVP